MNKNIETADNPKLFLNYFDLMRDWEPRPQWLDAGLIWKQPLANLEEAVATETTPDGAWWKVWHTLSRHANSFTFVGRVAGYQAAVGGKETLPGSEHIQRAATLGDVLHELVAQYVDWVGESPESWEQVHEWSKDLVRAVLLTTAQYLCTVASQNHKN